MKLAKRRPVLGFMLPGRGRLRGWNLEGKRVYLRPPRHGDYRSWANLRESSREFLTPWEPRWPADSTGRAAFRRRLHAMAVEWRHDEGYGLFVFRIDDDTLLGGVNLTHVRRGVAQTASLGYWIGEPFARQGYMTDALQALLPYAFQQIGLHRIEAACLLDNEASRRLLLKLGFREEGAARQYLRINDRWQDHRLFGLVDSDMPAPPQ
jgi:[ribosomal protein S5]-alanine N-acetyltransferase